MVIVGLSQKLGDMVLLLDDCVSERWFLGPTERYYRIVKVTKYFLKFKKIYIHFKETEKEVIIASFLKYRLKKRVRRNFFPYFQQENLGLLLKKNFLPL